MAEISSKSEEFDFSGGRRGLQLSKEAEIMLICLI